MKISKFSLCNGKRAALAICGLLALLGMVGTASAECVVDKTSNPADPSNFTLLIDASSSCSNLSANMFGCDVATGANGCRIDGPNNTFIEVTLDIGSVGGTIPLSWSSTGDKQVDFAIIVGANKGGSCGISYTPGSDFGKGLGFLKKNGEIQKMNAVSFCSDFTEPAAAEPRLVVTKTVVLKPEDEDADCLLSIETLDIAVGDEVTYCYTVENVGAGNAQDVTLEDDKGTPGDSYNVVLKDDFFGTEITTPVHLLSSVTAYGTLDVTITKAGTVVNTATAKLGDTFEASDTATVNAAIVAEICPDNFQDEVNQLSEATGMDFAFLLDPNQGGRLSVCTPDGGNNTKAAVRIQCIDQCITKSECQTDPNATGCAYSVCEASGAWTTDAGTTDCSAVATPPPGVLPFCWEVQQDLKKTCDIDPTKWESQEETVLNVKKGHVNPYIYQSCYSSGGRYVCETICFPFFDGDCP